MSLPDRNMHCTHDNNLSVVILTNVFAITTVQGVVPAGQSNTLLN